MEPGQNSRVRVSPLLRLQSDDRLAGLAAKGDEPAFETLVRRHRRVVDGTCRRVLPHEGAEDAAQQAMLNAHQALVRNGPPDRFEAWLRRIALNAALKEAGRHDTEAVPLDEESLDGVERPDEAHERREQLGRTIRAVAGLPPRQRSALVMHELEGRSHEEIAAKLGLTRGAIRQLIHRAREGVRGVATALTPLALLRTGGAGSGQASEVAVGGLAAGLGTKSAIALLATGGIAGGVALAPSDRSPDGRGERGADEAAIMGPEEASASDNAGPGSHSSGSGRAGRRDRDSSGPGDGDGRAAVDNSGPGSVSSGSGSGSSGSGSSGSGSSGSGSSGSDPSGSGSSGSGSSGSGSSGSGSGSSGSGSGSGDLDLD